jgi:hypothetical protein
LLLSWMRSSIRGTTDVDVIAEIVTYADTWSSQNTPGPLYRRRRAKRLSPADGIMAV